MNHKSESLINQIFFEKYKVIRKIGQGSFGRIYICQDIISNEFYAMKVEQISTLNRVLETESKYLNYLRGFGIPELIFFGREEKYFILIETLLGKSLENLYSESHGNFNIKDVCMIGIQILDRLEYIHNKNIIHRDIKPDNFVIGKNDEKNTIFMIDFGLAKRYRNPLTQEHIQFKLTKRLTGTARYASINALKGGEQSRKDDLESLNYMLLYFLRGSLPWQGVAGLTKGEKYKKIYHIKKNIGAEKLYENLPNEFKEVYLYVKKLEFEQDPDYDYCRKLFTDVIENKIGGIYDNYFTWCKEINSANKNHIFDDININKSSNNNDESGKTVKSTKIINICNSNILLDKVNNKKIKKISVTFIDNRNKNKNKIMNCAYNFNQDIKKNKSLLLDNIYNIYDFDDNENSKKTKNKEIIVTDSDKNSASIDGDDYSIEGEIEKKNKKDNKKEINQNKDDSKKVNKINILSLTKINQKDVKDFVKKNKIKKNLNKIKTSRDFYFSKKHLNYIVNSQICNQTTRNGYFKNRIKESHSKSSNKVKNKSKTNYSKLFKENFNNSPSKIKKSKNKMICKYNTHTNIRSKKKPKIKYSSNLQKKNKVSIGDKSNYKYSILLEDFINKKKNNSKNKYETSKASSIKNYFRNMQIYKINNNEYRDISLYSNNKYVKSTNTSKNKEINSFSKINKTTKHHSVSNKQLRIQQVFFKNKNKRNFIINVNKFTNKRNSSSNSRNKNKNKKSESYISRIYNNKKGQKETRNNTINIESVIFVGDNNDQSSKSQSKSKNKNKSKEKKIIFTPTNMFRKNDFKSEKSNFLNKFKINILSNKKKYKTNNNSIKNIMSTKIKKKGTKKKINNYHNISLKLTENKFKLRNRKTNIYNLNTKKSGPISFNNLISNVRNKRKFNINNNIFYNSSLMDKKIFIQNSFNSSDNNYILNNINNNNIIVNNYNNCNNNISSNLNNKKIINSFSINNKNIFPDEANENNSNINIGGISNNSNSIIKEIIFKNNNNINKKDNSRQDIMKFIKKFHKNNNRKSKIKK